MASPEVEAAGVDEVTEPAAPAAPQAEVRDDPGPPTDDPTRPSRAWAAIWPVVAMAVVGGLLLAFLVISPPHSISFGYFPRPPIYGHWTPAFGPQAFVVVPAAVVLLAVGVLVIARLRMPSWLALLLVVAAGVVLGAGVAMSRGGVQDITLRLGPGFAKYYTADMHVVAQYGVHGFTSRFPDLGPVFQVHNVRTHPPGTLVLYYVLFTALGASHTLRITLVLATLAMAAAVPAWMIGRELGGERAGRISAVLFAAAPGPLLLAYSAVDAIFATLLSSATALFVVALHRRSVRWAAAGGAVLAVTAYFTYAISFVGIAVVVTTLLAVRPVRDAGKLLAAGGAAGLVVLALERVALGFDLLRSYRSAAVDGVGRSYDPYWIVGHPASVLIYAGLPLAALGVVGLFRDGRDGRFAALPAVLVALMVVWGSLPAVITHLRPGEVERTWAFLYPLLAGTAGYVVARWVQERRRPWLGYALIVLLLVISVAQATLIKLLWVTINT